MHRAISWRRRTINAAADVAGKLTAVAVKTWPGVLGAGVLTYGVGMIYRPAACIVGGLFLLILDHRSPG